MKQAGALVKAPACFISHVLIACVPLLTDTPGRRRAYQRTHHRQIFLPTWQTLAYQVIWCLRKIILLQSHIRSQAIEERQLKVRRLTQRTMRTDLYTVATEDTAIKSERVTLQGAFSHHQRTGR